MLPVLSNRSLRELERNYFEATGARSLDLMELAGERCTARIVQLMNDGRLSSCSVVVFVGMGNNGGDGLVIARLLHTGGIPVRVERVRFSEVASQDHEINLTRALELGVPISEINDPTKTTHVSDNELIIDSIFGSGLTRPPSGVALAVIQAINGSKCFVVSIDQPSGLMDDLEHVAPSACVKADMTFVLEAPRPSFLFPEGGGSVGVPEVIPLGLNSEAIPEDERFGNWVQRYDIRDRSAHRDRFGHKRTFGSVLLVGGSKGHHGAILMAAQAAIRSGAGTVTAHVPGGLETGASCAIPEVMWSSDPALDHITEIPETNHYSAVGIGPGLGTDAATVVAFARYLAQCRTPLVLDADALNLLAAGLNSGMRPPQGAILTPHPKEMDRLLGMKPATGAERLERTRAFAAEHKCFVVLKGAYTAICGPTGMVDFNTTGNPGMAQGGSGDALTGLITGLLAQGMDARDACIVGVHLHGLAGDIAAEALSMEGMTTSDLIRAIPDAWKAVQAP